VAQEARGLNKNLVIHSDTRILCTYTPQLIEDTIRVFREEDGIVLTPEEAIVALEALAGLFLAFGKTPRTPVGSRGVVTIPYRLDRCTLNEHTGSHIV
jgi:hypothetical protein